MWCVNCRKNVTAMVSPAGNSLLCCGRCGASLPGAAVDSMAGASASSSDSGASTLLPCPEAGDCAAGPSCPAPMCVAVTEEITNRPAAETTILESPAVTEVAEAAPIEMPSLLDAVAEQPRQQVRQPLSAQESWEIDEDLLHMQRVLRRFDEPSQSMAGSAALPPPALPADAEPPASLGSLIAGLSLLAGMTSLACGVALLAWSWQGQRPDLFMPGLLCAVVGQCGLLLGLALRPAPLRQKPQPQPATQLPPLLTLTDLSSDGQWIARIDRCGSESAASLISGSR